MNSKLGDEWKGTLRDPWLVAVWPGMGGIAQIAGATLLQAPDIKRMTDPLPNGHFETEVVEVRGGLIQRPSLPADSLFVLRRPDDGPDLIVFVARQQPLAGGHRFCEALIDLAQEWGVTRVVTFAAMAAPTRPESDARVFGAATDPEILKELQAVGVKVLTEGKIKGMNGLLLSVAAERSIGGFCLLGEFPFFARAVVNPKASAAVLRVFARLARLELNLTALDTDAIEVERVLSDHLSVLEDEAERASKSANGDHDEAPPEVPDVTRKIDALPGRVSARIEELFERARGDRTKAYELKAELDRHAVFDDYEDRFLDLFKEAE